MTCVLDVHSYARHRDRVVGDGEVDAADLVDLWVRLAERVGRGPPGRARAHERAPRRPGRRAGVGGGRAGGRHRPARGRRPQPGLGAGRAVVLRGELGRDPPALVGGGPARPQRPRGALLPGRRQRAARHLPPPVRRGRRRRARRGLRGPARQGPDRAVRLRGLLPPPRRARPAGRDRLARGRAGRGAPARTRRAGPSSARPPTPCSTRPAWTSRAGRRGSSGARTTRCPSTRAPRSGSPTVVAEVVERHPGVA